MLHLSPSIFIASFNEISCSIVFPVFRFTLALASYNFVCKIPQLVCFKCKSWQAAHLKCFCSSSLLQIQNQQAALWNYLAPCKWTSAIPTRPPTRFGENHWHAVSTCKWLLRVATVCDHRVKISPVKPHLHGRLFCNAIRRFLMRENLSRRVVTHTRRDSLCAIAFGKNRRRVSNTCDLRCRL